MRNEDRDAWTEPGTFEVAPGVHRIPLPLPGDGLRAINVYALDDGDGITLVDCGWRHPKAVEALRAGLAALGSDGRNVTRVIATHAHYDHYGLTAYLRDHAGCEIALGRDEVGMLAPAIDDGGWEAANDHRRAYMVRHGASDLMAEIERQAEQEDYESVRGRGRWEMPDVLLDDGDVLAVGDRRLRAILTPGHTRGHMAFHDEANGLFFAGDHVLPHITPSLGFETWPDGRALARFQAALLKVRDVPADLVLPGHGPVFDDLAERVDELLAHHEQRLARCVDIVADDGPDSALDVARRLPWTRRDTPFVELDVLNRLLAVGETVTHLERLVDTGTLHRDEAADVVLYAAA
ncbi:MAG: hypothetical protein QOF76_2199 [Solirubrobacteraceae bacterium]|jgi:glyoxylase-like metal-dependent hydrolase (beta-lactamase superfamily II)|nr:hypothetical protein [Solirubrobacteraceae bacterium]